MPLIKHRNDFYWRITIIQLNKYQFSYWFMTHIGWHAVKKTFNQSFCYQIKMRCTHFHYLEVLFNYIAIAHWFLTSWGTSIFIMHAYIYSVVLILRCLRRRRTPSRWTYTRAAAAPSSSGSWPSPTPRRSRAWSSSGKALKVWRALWG